MCGFFGSLNYSGEKFDLKSINRALNTLSHRGPDSEGVEKLDNVVFGHRRLAIIDITTDSGKQPVVGQNSLLVFNGMIYNFLEIKKELLKNHNTFKGNSDTEVLAKSLNQWGIRKTLKKIDGMFAFAWFSKKKSELYLVRDPMGEKPLYWAKKNNKIYFSSEMKAFFEIPGFSKKLNINRIDEYLYTAKINGSETIYSEINEVEPGSIVTISTLTNSISSNSYFSIEDTFNRESIKKNKVESLKNYLEESVMSRTLSDVPLGSLLSGGIDSSIILRFIMQNDLINKINCYTADTKNSKISEFNDANKFVSFLRKKNKYKKINLKTQKINFSSYISLLKESTKFLDEPIPFSNSPNLLGLCKIASKDGIKVLLSGEGADEILFGYNRYTKAYEYLKNNKSKKSIIEEMYHGGGMHSIDCVKKLCGSLKEGRKTSSSWLKLEKNINKYFIEDLIPMFSQKFRLQTLLQRQDRLGMATGIEMRIPFLSKKIVELANALPFKDKYNKKSGTTKVLLRLMAKELLPNNIINKPKLGFEMDMKDWITEDKTKILFKNMINDKKGFFSGYLDGKNAREILDLHFSGKRRLDTLVWNMFALETWHRVCGEGDNTLIEEAK